MVMRRAMKEKYKVPCERDLQNAQNMLDMQ